MESLHQKNSAELAAITATLLTLKNKEREVAGLIESKSGEFKEALFRYQAKKDAIIAAKNTLNKARNINLRLSEKDVQKIVNNSNSTA